MIGKVLLTPAKEVTVTLTTQLIDSENWVQVWFTPDLNEAVGQSQLKRECVSEQIHAAALDLVAKLTGLEVSQLQVKPSHSLYYCVGIEPVDKSAQLKIIS